MTAREERIAGILDSLKQQVHEMSKSEFRPVLNRAIRDVAGELAGEARESGAGVEELLSRWKESFPIAEFWTEVETQVVDILEPYRDTAFLRDLPEERQRELLAEVLEQGIRYHEQIDYLSEQLGITEDQLKTVVKMYNTLIRWSLIDRVSRRCFLLKCKEYFGFSEALAAFLWELLEKNRSMLAERLLIKTVSENQTTLKRLVKVLIEAFSEDNEDGEEDEEP